MIPLPYTTVTVAVRNYGVAEKNHIPELPTSAPEPVRESVNGQKYGEKTVTKVPGTLRT